MDKPEKLKLTQDFIIPAGTTFECIDGTKRNYVGGNYEATIATSKDTTMNIVVCEDELHNYQGLFRNPDEINKVINVYQKDNKDLLASIKIKTDGGIEVIAHDDVGVDMD